MLWNRWQRTQQAFREEMALFDHATGRSWSFGDLDDAVADAGDAGGVIFAQGHDFPFIVQTLAAWKARRPLVPVEAAAGLPVAAFDNVPLPGQVAHVKTTSGSTGNPRFVLFSEDQIAADADNIVATMQLSREWPNIGIISLAHSYGFSNLVTPLLLHGIPLILAPDPLPETLRGVLARQQAAALPAVPAMWKAWLQAGALSSKIKIAVSAGAPLAATLERQVFDATGVKIHNFYGSSECGGIAFDRTHVPRPDNATTVGTPLEGVYVERREDDGLLVVTGAAVGTTYWPSAEKNILHHGAFTTSDIGTIDDDGIHLLGRASDIINVAGRKVSPQEIEKHIGKVAGVKHCVVFGIPSDNPERVEDIVAVYATECGSSTPAGKSELESALAGDLPTWKIPRRWVHDDSLAPDARGKISRHQWRKRILSP